MMLLDRIAENRIQEALAQGVLDDLPGKGAPLALDDDHMVPEHLRSAYRILRNSGHLPQEVTVYSEIRNVESLIARTQDAGQRATLAGRLSLLRARLGFQRGANLALEDEYYRALADRLDPE